VVVAAGITSGSTYVELDEELAAPVLVVEVSAGITRFVEETKTDGEGLLFIVSANDSANEDVKTEVDEELTEAILVVYVCGVDRTISDSGVTDSRAAVASCDEDVVLVVEMLLVVEVNIEEVSTDDDNSSLGIADVPSVVVIEVAAVDPCCQEDELEVDVLLEMTINIVEVVDVVTILVVDTTPAVSAILAPAALSPTLRRPIVAPRSG